MLDANYVKHFKVLGKLCRLWDDASADESAMKLLIARTFDQVATGELPSYDPLLIVNSYTAALNSAVNNGAAALKTIAENVAATYLTSAVFRDDLTTTPGSPGSAKSVLEALQTDMGAGVDNKTLTDVASTGFVNFFDTVWDPSGSWNTEPDGTADYPDSTYVVITIVT